MNGLISESTELDGLISESLELDGLISRSTKLNGLIMSTTEMNGLISGIKWTDQRIQMCEQGAYNAEEATRWGEGGAHFGTEDARPPEWAHLHLVLLGCRVWGVGWCGV